MVIKNKTCLAFSFIIPVLLIVYFALQISRLKETLIPIRATIRTFKTKGSHSSYRKVITLDEYPASLVRYYQGAHLLFVKNFRDVIYEPPAPHEIPEIYYLHPRLKSKSQREVSLFIHKNDTTALKQSGLQIPYFYLKMRSTRGSAAGYNIDLYHDVYRQNNGAAVLLISVLLFIGCCMGASWRYQQNKLLLAYAIFIIITHALLFVFG